MSQQEIKESEMILRIIRIYIVDYLSTVRTPFPNYRRHQMLSAGSHKYTRSLYPQKYRQHNHSAVQGLAIQTKRTAGLQGRTIPNCLHLIDTL